MTTATAGGYTDAELATVVDQACAHAGLDSTGARLLRGHTNAVVLLATAPVVLKAARKGSDPAAVARTTALVRWLTRSQFPTVALHPGIRQPFLADGHPVTYWTYLPQTGTGPVTAADLAAPLRALHRLPGPPVTLRRLDNLTAIHRSLAATDTLTPAEHAFLTDRAHTLEHRLHAVEYVLPAGTVQGDPQHGNALKDGHGRTVLCDWDTAAHGHPEWDLVTVEIHCRRFGHGRRHWDGFAAVYGLDITAWPGYPVLRDIRELRMITTNARKTTHTPGTLTEVRRRIKGLRNPDDHTVWNIL
ncbi:phosphotransferase [Streptomyces uncialis]|uniref:phosphotransferase n=1 Tax=Streptomyces uncialis TaxID=1048205 RepID=UPI00340E6C7A